MFDIKETINKGVIYKLKSPSGKVYIGQSIDFKSRLKKYKNNNKKSIGQYLYNAIKKYGFANFDIEIIETILLDKDIKIIKDDLNTLEMYYIKKFDSFNNGYNLTIGGAGSFKRIVTQKTRLKLSEANKGKNIKDKVLLICPICHKKFYLQQGQINGRMRTNKTIETISCSKECGYIKLRKNK